MKRTKFIAGLAAIAVAILLARTSLAGDAKKIGLTAENTKIDWLGTKPGGKHTGGFTKLTGTLEAEGKALKKVSLEIDTNSLTSDNPKLTKHLKSPDFFECLNFPKATFVTTKIQAGEDSKTTITGDLTIRDKTKSITFPATVSAADGVTLTSTFEISKKEFGMIYGEGKIDDKVKITVSIKAK